MPFDRTLLPEPAGYFASQGLTLKGPHRSPWQTTACSFHGGSDSMRFNLVSGGFVCMNCGVKGGDVLAYEMQASSLEFVAAAKALGAWVEDGRGPAGPQKPSPLSPRQALAVLSFESLIVAVAAGNLANGQPITDADRSRLRVCSNRITRLAEDFQS